MAASKKGFPLSLLSLLGLGFIAVGVFAGINHANRQQREARALQQLPEVDAPAVAHSVAGTRLAVTGSLADPDDQAEDGGLLIYQEQRWTVNYDEDSGWEGRWDTRYTVIPACRLDLPGGHVELYATDAAALYNTLHEIRTYTPEQGQEVAGIQEGSRRRIGFRVGDQVTVVGVKTAEGLLPELVSGGDRMTVVKYFEGEVLGARITGVIFGLVGVILVGVDVWLRLRR